MMQPASIIFELSYFPGEMLPLSQARVQHGRVVVTIVIVVVVMVKIVAEKWTKKTKQLNCHVRSNDWFNQVEIYTLD